MRLVKTAVIAFTIVTVFASCQPTVWALDSDKCYYTSLKGVQSCTDCHVKANPTTRSRELKPLSQVPARVKNTSDFKRSGAQSLFTVDRTTWNLERNRSGSHRSSGANNSTENIDIFGVSSNESSSTVNSGNTNGNNSWNTTSSDNGWNTRSDSGLAVNSGNRNESLNSSSNNNQEIRYTLRRGDVISEVVADIVNFELQKAGIRKMNSEELSSMVTTVKRHNRVRWSFGDPVSGDILGILVSDIQAMANTIGGETTQNASAGSNNGWGNESSSDDNGWNTDTGSFGFLNNATTEDSWRDVTTESSTSNTGTEDSWGDVRNVTTTATNHSTGNTNRINTATNTNVPQLEQTLPLSATNAELKKAGRKEIDELQSGIDKIFKGSVASHLEKDAGSQMTTWNFGYDEIAEIEAMVGGFTDNGNRSALRCPGATAAKLQRIRDAIEALQEPLARDVHVFGIGSDPEDTKDEAVQEAKTRIHELKIALNDLKDTL